MGPKGYEMGEQDMIDRREEKHRRRDRRAGTKPRRMPRAAWHHHGPRMEAVSSSRDSSSQQTTSSMMMSSISTCSRPKLACGNCVSCCDPAVPSSPSSSSMEEVAEEWRAEEEARRASIAESHERYHSRGGEGCFGGDAASCRRKLAMMLPLIVMRRDGTLVQYDPRPVSSGERSQSPDEQACAEDAKATKVTLNGLYRENGDSVCFAGDGRRRGLLFGGGGGGSQDDLVSVLGLLKVRESSLRLRRLRGRRVAALPSLLLPLKMTNVSITAKVEDADADFVAMERSRSLSSSGGSAWDEDRRGAPLAKDEFNAKLFDPAPPGRSDRGEKHSRNWSWDSCFSSSSSFRDLSPLAVGETPSQSAAAVAGSYASALKERFLRRPSFFQNHHQQQARAFGAGPKEIKTA